jgi:hypothetical protein
MTLIDQAAQMLGPMTNREMKDLYARLQENLDDIPRLELVCVALGNWPAYCSACMRAKQFRRERRS